MCIHARTRAPRNEQELGTQLGARSAESLRAHVCARLAAIYHCRRVACLQVTRVINRSWHTSERACVRARAHTSRLVSHIHTLLCHPSLHLTPTRGAWPPGHPRPMHAPALRTRLRTPPPQVPPAPQAPLHCLRPSQAKRPAGCSLVAWHFGHLRSSGVFAPSMFALNNVPAAGKAACHVACCTLHCKASQKRPARGPVCVICARPPRARLQCGARRALVCRAPGCTPCQLHARHYIAPLRLRCQQQYQTAIEINASISNKGPPVPSWPGHLRRL